MNKKTLEKFKNLLLEEKSKITQAISQESGLDVDFEGDEIDEIQGTLIVSIQNQLSGRDREKISKIDLALSKINQNTFGICEDCGEEIPERRLTFNPHSSTCVGCAEDREMRTKRR